MKFLHSGREAKWLSTLFALASLVVPAAGQQLEVRKVRAKNTMDADHLRALQMLSKQPLSFEQVPGSESTRAQFASRGLEYSLLLTPSEAMLALRQASLRMKLVGANPDAAGAGLEEFKGRVNYFVGNDSQKWNKNVRSFTRVKYAGVYPGVDLIYYGTQKQLEYDFVLRPGADPDVIGLDLHGAKSVRIDRHGDLLLKTPDGMVRLHRPQAYQDSAGAERIPVDVRYAVRHRREATFQLGAYDKSKPLVIDPVVSFATYIGGDMDASGFAAGTEAFGIATDLSGNIYITGETNAANDGVFPVFHAYQTNPPSKDPSCRQVNAFVAKLDAAGNRVYVTYLGGTSCNLGAAIAADEQGNAIVTGWTKSSDFPVTSGAFQGTKPNAGATLASWVTKFDATGGIVYSSFISDDAPGGVATDSTGNAYLTGATGTAFSAKTTAGAFETNCTASDSYVLELSPAGVPMYSSCLGNGIRSSAIAVDSSGNIYVLATTGAGASVVIKNGFQSTTTSSQDAFLAKLFPGGAGAADLLYSTFFGGSRDDDVFGMAANSNGQVWIVGNTGSADLPVTTTANRSTCVPRTAGTCTAWVAKFDTALTGTASRVFAAYLGGNSGDDNAAGVVLDPTGNAYVGGFTASADFPTVNPLYGCPGCANFNESSFLTEFSPTGAILFSTFLGGSAASGGSDETFGIAMDPLGNILLAGMSGTGNLPPATPIPACMNPVQSQLVGSEDAFVLKISPGNAQSTTTVAASSADPAVFGEQVTFTAKVSPTMCTAGTPAGTVTILDGTTPLGSGPLVNNQFAVSSATLVLGTHNITASYAGGSGFTASTSPVLIETIRPASSLTIIASSENPANPAQSVTFTATVLPVAPGAGVPTGSVIFFDGATMLGTSVLTAQVATLSTSALGLGAHSITASYGGDANFAASTSAPLLQQIAMTPPVISKIFGTGVILQGSTIDLDFNIANPNSTSALAGVGVVDTLPSGMVVATPSTITGTCGGGTISALSGSSTISLSGATLPPGANCVFSVNVTGISAGFLINVSGPVTASNTASGNQAVASITVAPSLVTIEVDESIKVTDTPVVPSVFVNVAESIKVTDTLAIANTASGSNVAVKPVDTTTGATPVTLTFASVVQPGLTSLTTSTGGPPPPSGFQLGNPPVYYNLTTTAGYTGAIQICLNYTGISFSTPPGPRLYHYQGGSWIDVTVSVDTTNRIVCGSSTSLSPFALFSSAGIPTTTSITEPRVTYGSAASVTVSVGASNGTPAGIVSLTVDGGSALSMTLTGGSATFPLSILSAGSHTLAASFAAQNSFLASTTMASLNVIQAPLVIAANHVSRPYGSNNPVLTGSIVGLVNGDAITASFVTSAVPVSSVGTYTIVPMVLDPQNRLSNYAVTLVDGTLTVAPETTALRVAVAAVSIPVGQSAAITVTLTAPDMVIPISSSALAPIVFTSSVVSDIFSNNGTCSPVPSAAPGTASCMVILTAVEPSGRTINAHFAGSNALVTSSGAANLTVTAPLQSKVSCIRSSFNNVAVPGGDYLWYNSVFSARDLPKRKTTVTFFQSSVQYQYLDVDKKLVKVNLSVPDAKIVIDPSATEASTVFDSSYNLWITILPYDLDGDAFLTGVPWLVPAGGIPGDIEPVTWCGTFASDTPGVELGWRWAAAAYATLSGDNGLLGIKVAGGRDDQPPQDRAGTPENFKAFVVPGARGRGNKNYTGNYTDRANATGVIGQQ